MAETKENNPSTAFGANKTRPPVVVIVGHVDHGKTTLLDYIRKSNVAAKEAGGITQGVSAYEIVVHPDGKQQPRESEANRATPRQTRDDFSADSRKITFIDTPGHEAFTAMRSRGAQIADMAILVVAGDEGPKPQTLEAIQILKDTETPYIVALTKSDRNNSNVDKVKNELFAAGVALEGYGGQVSCQSVSAKTGEGVDELLELILLQAEMDSHTYDPGKNATGFVLEVRWTKQRGREVAIIIKDGILRRGEAIATKSAIGKIKILENFAGDSVSDLSPSAPALIVGFEDSPKVGEEFFTGSSAEELIQKGSSKQFSGSSVANYESTENKFQNLILKSQDAGSLEVLSSIIRALPPGERPARIVAESVGDVSDGDAQLALATNSTIICFKTKVAKSVQALVETRGLKIVSSEIIYELVQAVEAALNDKPDMSGSGELEVLALFNQARLSEQLVGGKILSGTFRERRPFQVLRGSAFIAHGKVLTMREKKNSITSASEGQEVGAVVECGIKIEVGDKLVIT